MNNEIVGNILEEYKNFDAICITTNGKVKKDGKAVMGAGVAKACRDYFKGSDKNLADMLKRNGNCTQLFDTRDGVSIIAFPTKEDWRDASDIELIKRSSEQLVELMNTYGFNSVLLPQPGCTNGGLEWDYVREIIQPILDDRVTFISKGKILECSSKGDKRFSAFYAKVKLFGKYDSIENHYQLSKRIGDFVPTNWKDVKGKKPTHLHIDGHDYDLKYTEAWYDLLWVSYFKNNPDLVEYAKKFDDYNDIFKSKNAIVCQADSITKYIEIGRSGILKEHKEFIDLIKEKRGV